MLVDVPSKTARADAEMLEIVQYLLLSSPSGEFDEVWYDAQVLVPELVSPQILAGIARAHNHENLSVATTADGLHVLLHTAAETSPTRYVDYTTRATFRVDHVLRGAVTVQEMLLPTVHEVVRNAIDDAARSYVMMTFDEAARPITAVHVNVGRAELVIALSGERANLSNFWSGNWRSEWTVALGDGEAIVSGIIKVRAHYFEEGNVQLQTTKAFHPARILFETPCMLGTVIIEQVRTAESALQYGLEKMYDNVPVETAKAMRRILPITHVKMNWNINELSLNRSFNLANNA